MKRRNSSQPRKHSWYKRKNYLHFDFALKKPQAVKYVTDTGNIVKHNFSPLIHYIKKSRQFKLDKKTDKLRVHFKPRNIFYTSHVDGYLYSYYAYLLSQRYEDYLTKNNLTENVSAYRLIKRDGRSCSNIHFAKEAFEFIKSTKGCNVVCVDISKFFDRLCLDVLKENWGRVWSGGTSRELDEDHYRVFKSLSGFHYIEEKDIIRVFGKEPRKREKIDKSDGHEVKEALKRSLHERICSYLELRTKKVSLVGVPFIRRKSKLGITGIPQGTAISGLLANIFMIDFDAQIKSRVESCGGLYRRYSDDILLAFPCSISFQSMIEFVQDALKVLSRGSLEINPDKTEECIYKEDVNGVGLCRGIDGKRMTIQYLGFEFDGNKTYIRGSSVSRNRSKISCVIKKNKEVIEGGGCKINTREVYKAQSPRRITPSDRVENKGFVSYAIRAQEIQKASEIRKQIRKNDRFLRKRILKERLSRKG